MILTYWPLLVSLGAVGLAYFLGVVTGRRGAAAARVDAQHWEELAEDRRVYIHSLEEARRRVVASPNDCELDSDEQLLAESKKRIEEISAQLIQNQEQLIELLRAQLTEQQARMVSVEQLAGEWAQVAAERHRRIGELEVKAVVEQGTIVQLRVVNAELQRRLDQSATEAA